MPHPRLVEAEGVAGKESGIAEYVESGLAVYVNVNQIHIAESRGRSVLVVADQGVVLVQDDTVGAVVAAFRRFGLHQPMDFAPQACDEHLFIIQPHPFGHTLDFLTISGKPVLV